MKSRNLLYFIIILGTYADNVYAKEPKVDNDLQAQSMLSVLYTQSSAEFEVDKALLNKKWTAALEQKDNYQTKPPAVILDIDETVLNNIPFQARAIIKGESYPKGWLEWMLEESATAVAGVADFLQYASQKGVKVFYVTNRIAVAEDATRNNIRKLGLPLDEDEDVLLMKNENGWTSDKVSRRELISNNYRVLLLIGDQLGDFISLEEATVSMNERQKLATKYQDMWGTKWFMITNPIYGRWEASKYENTDTGFISFFYSLAFVMAIKR